jgi:hypothetical protein
MDVGWSYSASRWILAVMLENYGHEGPRLAMDPGETSNGKVEKQGLFISTRGENPLSLPVAKLLFYDFPLYEPSGWELSPNGSLYSVPYAPSARVDPPDRFPEIPFIDTDAQIRESAEGLYEVANILQGMNPTVKIVKAYHKKLKSLKGGYYHMRITAVDNNVISKDDDALSAKSTAPCSELRSNGTTRQLVIQICEDTIYEIEALIGAVQIFGDKTLNDVLGIERIGVFMTFRNFSYQQNFNLNLVMTQWIKENWLFPFANEDESVRLAIKYGFPALAIERWLENARTIVWRPLLGQDILEDMMPVTSIDVAAQIVKRLEGRFLLHPREMVERKPSGE